MQEQYGEYTIKYEELQEKFVAYLGESREMSSGKLSDLKTRLDKVSDEKKKFEKVPVFKIELTDSKDSVELLEGFITSVAEDGKPWVSWKNGKREKVWLSNVPFLYTKENRDTFVSYKELYDKIYVMKNNLNNVSKSMKRYSN